MKFCAKCGTELLENGSCPSCNQPKSAVATQVRDGSRNWLEQMFQFFMVAFAVSGFMHFTLWPIILITGVFDLTPSATFYFLSVGISSLIVAALAFVLRGKVVLLAAVFVSGIMIWFVPEFLNFLVFGLSDGISLETFFRNLDPLGDLSSFIMTTPSEFSQVYSVVVTIGFTLMSLAHLPLVAVGVIAIGQEAISENLRNRKSTTSESGTDGALVIGAFIAAFIVPIAGLVLSLIAVVKWSTLSQRNKGLVVAALAISALTLVFSIVFGLLFITTLTPILSGLFESLSFLF